MPPRSHHIPPAHPWLAITVLGLASFSMVATEFAPIGLFWALAAAAATRIAAPGRAGLATAIQLTLPSDRPNWKIRA